MRSTTGNLEKDMKTSKETLANTQTDYNNSSLEQEKMKSNLSEKEPEILEDDEKLKEEVAELKSRLEGRDMESGISSAAPVGLDSEKLKKYKKVARTLKDKREKLVDENNELKEKLVHGSPSARRRSESRLHLSQSSFDGEGGNLAMSPRLPATPNDGRLHGQDREEPLRGLHGN